MSSIDAIVGGASSRPGGNDIVEWGPPGQQLFGRFNIKKGEGASKTVWEAYDAKNGNLVAWSEVSTAGLSAEERARVAAEVQVLREVRHDRLVDLYASWTSDDKVVLITAICESGDLQRFYRTHDVKLKVVKKLCRQILSGIRYLHSFKPPIIHRDLKCENILYDAATGTVRIGDLGLSTRVLDSSTCAVLGTPNYMAPELYEGVYNEGVDIYSFGMCVLEMVTKRLPYDECGNAAQMYRKVTQGLLPDAFYRVKYPSVQDFIRYCLTPLSSSSASGAGLGLQDGSSAAAPPTILRPSVSDVLAHPFLDEHASPPPPEDEVADLCWGEQAPAEGGAGTGGGPESDMGTGRSGEGHASGGRSSSAGGSGGDEGGSGAGGRTAGSSGAADANVSFTMAEEELPPRRPESVAASSGRASPELPANNQSSGGSAGVSPHEHLPRHARGITVEVLGPQPHGEASGSRRSSSAGLGVGVGSPTSAGSSGLVAVSNLLVDDHRGSGSRRGSGGLPPSFPASRRSSSLPSATPSRRGSVVVGGVASLQAIPASSPSPVLRDAGSEGANTGGAASPTVVEPEPLRYRLPSDGQPEVLLYAPLPEAAPPTGSAPVDGSAFVMQPLGQPLLAGSHDVMEMAPITVYDAGALEAGGTADAVMAVQTGYPVSVSPTTALSAHAIHDHATDLGSAGTEQGAGQGSVSVSGVEGEPEPHSSADASHLQSHGAESLVALGQVGAGAGGEGHQSLSATVGGGLVMLTGDAEVPVTSAADMTLPVTGAEGVGASGSGLDGSGASSSDGNTGMAAAAGLLDGVPQQEQQGGGAVGAASGTTASSASGLPSVSDSIRVKLLLDVDLPGTSSSERDSDSGTITRASITFDLDPSAVDVVSTALELAGRLSFLVGLELPPALADVIASFLTTQLFGIKTTVTTGPVPAWGIRQLAMWQPRGDEAVPGGGSGSAGSERAGWGKSRGADHGSHRTSVRGRSRGGGGSSAGGTREPLLHHDEPVPTGAADVGGAEGGVEGGTPAPDGAAFPLASSQVEATEPDPLASTIPATTAGLLTTLSPLPDYLLSPEKPRRGRRRSRLSTLAALGGGGGGLPGEEGDAALGGGGTGMEQADGFGGVGMGEGLAEGETGVGAGEGGGDDPYLIIDGSASVSGGALATVTTDYGGVPITGVSSLGGLVHTLDSVGGLDLLSNVTSGGYKVGSTAGLPGQDVTATATVTLEQPSAAIPMEPGAADVVPPTAASVAQPSSVVSHLSPSTASLDASNITPTPTTVNEIGTAGLSILTTATGDEVQHEAGQEAVTADGAMPQRLLLSPTVYAAGAPPSDFTAATPRQA